MDLRREAGRLAKELGAALGETPSIRSGGIGVLDVIADGRVVFSKKAEGRVPPIGELVTRLKAAG